MLLFVAKILIHIKIESDDASDSSSSKARARKRKATKGMFLVFRSRMHLLISFRIEPAERNFVTLQRR